MERLKVGKIIDSFSLDGSLKVLSSTTMASKRYQKGNKIFFVHENEIIEKEIEEYRHQGQFDFIKVNDINTKEEADQFINWQIEVIKNSDDLDEGYYFYCDLIGSKIITEEGKELGNVINVEEFPAQITLRVKKEDGKAFFVPFIKVFIKKVDIAKKEIIIHYMDGLL